MDIIEEIKKCMNSDLSENIKDKRLLILNTKLYKEQYENKIRTLVNNFIEDYSSSNLNYNLEPNLRHMLILLKGDILESAFCKKINNLFTIRELEQYVYQAQGQGEDLFELSMNIKLYKQLDEINELHNDLKSILLNTINVVLDKKHTFIDANTNNEIINLYKNQIIDETSFNLLKEYINYINNSIIILE